MWLCCSQKWGTMKLECYIIFMLQGIVLLTFFSNLIKMHKQFSAQGLHKNWQQARVGSRFIVCWPLIWKIISIILWAFCKYDVDYYGMKKMMINMMMIIMIKEITKVNSKQCNVFLPFTIWSSNFLISCYNSFKRLFLFFVMAL